MAIIPRLLFLLVLIVAPIVVYATSAGLPERVATHFGSGGLANGWMRHDVYLAFMLLMSTLLPLVVVVLTGFVPRIAVSQIKIANRDHWLSPARRAETLAWLAGHASWLGIVLTLFLVGMHVLIVRANEVRPARLDEALFFMLMAAFVVLIIAWIVAMTLRFRRAL
jgi:uncharacterized membrane protein